MSPSGSEGPGCCSPLTRSVRSPGGPGLKNTQGMMGNGILTHIKWMRPEEVTFPPKKAGFVLIKLNKIEKKLIILITAHTLELMKYEDI